MTTLLDYWRIFKARGFTRLFDELYQNGLYDFIHGTDTQTYLPLSQYNTEHPHLIHAVQYQPTYTYCIRRAFSIINTEQPITGSFIDYGCGKGKVLLEAMKYPFTQIHGIDLNPQLIDIAKQNIAKMHDHDNRINLHMGDALEFIPPENTKVLFMFNPFNESIMEKLFAKLHDIFKYRHDDIFLIYVNPAHTVYLTHWQLLSSFNKHMQNVAIYTYRGQLKK